MKSQYVKPTIKVRQILCNETFLAASGEEDTTTLQIFNNQTIDNDKSLAKPNMINWDDEDE